ncbi:SPOR domain-containing protein [Sulfurospirillum deleyianum]|uniref:Sporulation domain protein n=1 Tax=Sulfurospirillum deleyianum (strain ATCC 51133 / DSM 6946 / 5175) TaxID=525898 RepID=D1AZZ2_SULD5|nr:SPOR domain-containing protein [Sulfurospirillum deleyianum]ACZ11609.1 Sporulation domain protein [Sulfurospirillum deleyianum DSM 6946]
MENRNELSDIVLEKGDNKTLKVKRILILVAFLILVFLVALASMKVANKDANKEASKLILPPEPTQETQIPKDDQLFKQVPIIEENPKKESFEDMIKTLKEKEAQKQEETKNTPETSTSTTTETAVATLPVQKVKEEAKKEASKPQTMLRSTEIDTPSTSGGAVSAGIYVQVGAVATTPTAKQLADFKAKGYECKAYSTVVNGNKVIKLLVGPYANSAEADNALKNIRANLNKNAFIYRVK